MHWAMGTIWDVSIFNDYQLMNIHIFLYKQPVYKQLGLALQKVKQLLGPKHVT